MNIIKFLLIFIILGINYSFAAINLAVSPIKYELLGNTGSTITKTALLHNRGDNEVKIITGKTDFIASGTDGSPTLVRYSELVHPDQQLSSWITLSSSGFTIPAKTKKEINFTINVPEDATPGGHYGAVCFKNNNSESSSSSGAKTGINVDYCIIILLKIEGEIITDVVIDTNKIEINKHSGGGYSKHKDNYNLTKTNQNLTKKDNCLIDFTSSLYDGKCFEEPEKAIELAIGEKNLEKIENKLNIKIIEKNIKDKKIDEIIYDNINDNLDINSNNKDNDEDNNDFKVSFKIPVENKGNTHIKATGEIKLFDEDGNQIKQIGKKIRVNDNGAIIGEDIVDYVPVNDSNGNVLPGTKRFFNSDWQGFPYKEYSQELGKEVIKYKNPGEYYSDKELKKEFRLLPWERVCYDKQNKKITAKFDLSYINEEGKEVSFPSAKEFNIEYTRKYIGYNYYFIFFIVGIIVLLLILFWIIGLFRKKRCINPDCRKRIKKKAKICPYCETIQIKQKKEKDKTSENKKKKKSKKKKKK